MYRNISNSHGRLHEETRANQRDFDDELSSPSFYTQSLRQILESLKVLMANSDPLCFSGPLLASPTLPRTRVDLAHCDPQHNTLTLSGCDVGRNARDCAELRESDRCETLSSIKRTQTNNGLCQYWLYLRNCSIRKRCQGIFSKKKVFLEWILGRKSKDSVYVVSSTNSESYSD